jgi:N6-adenosine-specific RNA methylase IME4
LTLPQIKRFRLPPIADTAWLFLWRVASMVPEAYEVVEAWGFRPVSEIVWVKTTGDGVTPRIGMGSYVRNAHECCIVAVRGTASSTRLSCREPSVVLAPRGRHSEKPASVAALIERLAPGPRVELFARGFRPGWTSLGRELARRSQSGG